MAVEIARYATGLGVPNEVMSAEILRRFESTRLAYLDDREAAELMAWLQEEFGQAKELPEPTSAPEPTPEPETELKDIPELPF